MSRASRLRLATLAASFVSLVIAACDSSRPAIPDAARAAGGPALGKAPAGPRVDSTTPPTAPRGTTLDVRVVGSGFDAGSRVSFELGGTAQGKVVVNATRYVSSGELVASVTIGGDAPLDAYDVVVTMIGGKKGIGVEMFTVTYEESQVSSFGTASLFDVNVSDWMVGTTNLNGGTPRHATLWRDGQALDIHPAVNGLPTSYATSVNDAGTIVGYANESATGNERALVWTSIAPVGVAQLATIGGAFGEARGINNAGQIVGASGAGTNAMHAVLWPSAGATPVLLLTDAQRAQFALSQAEQVSEALGDTVWVAGWAEVTYGTSARSPFVWKVVGGVPVSSERLPIPALRGYTRASAYSVNRHGVVVGRSSGDRQPFRAVRWRRASGAWTVDTLPGLIAGGNGGAEDVNDLGQIVGYADAKVNGGVTVLWSPWDGGISVLRLSSQTVGNNTHMAITNGPIAEANVIVAGRYRFVYPTL